MLSNVTATSTFMEAFDWAKRDVRVDDWPMMSSIYPTLIICFLYVLFAEYLGPKFMENREPYNIKAAVMAYNIIQVGGSMWIFQGVLRNGWLAGYNHVCQDVDRNPSPTSTGYIIATFIWWAYLFRFLDFMDTLFFVMRKKYENVNMLQVIHHWITPIYFWIMVRYVPGGNDTLLVLINYFVHSIMYSYYFLSALGPQYQKYLWWKRYLTKLQILQFIIVFFKSGVNMVGLTNCGYPWQFSLITVALMVLMFYLFGDFYIRTYINKGKAQANGSNGVKRD